MMVLNLKQALLLSLFKRRQRGASWRMLSNWLKNATPSAIYNCINVLKRAGSVAKKYKPFKSQVTRFVITDEGIDKLIEDNLIDPLEKLLVSGEK